MRIVLGLVILVVPKNKNTPLMLILSNALAKDSGPKPLNPKPLNP